MLLALQVTVLSAFSVALNQLGTASFADLHSAVRQSRHRHVTRLVDSIALVLESVYEFHQSARLFDFCIFDQQFDLPMYISKRYLTLRCDPHIILY